ncbi:MAG: hydantoinase/oxoprolinase family protein [Betaproteobacteria bacterium]|nr:hydantoinase/oxoprolinase family protein [Betaproteobacteria bacterium]
MTTGQYRFGFDIGGTFTDIVVADAGGRVHVGKCLSTPDAFTRAVVDGLVEVIQREAIPRERIEKTICGATTVVTNLIIEQKGAPTGLLTTEGFPDLIEMARESRYDIYDIKARLPKPIVPRGWRKEVRERVDRDGIVVTPLDEASVERAIRELVAEGVQSIAVSLLHAYRFSAHERRVREIAAAVAPALYVSLSSDVLPEIREYERTVATALNAYARPLIGRYLEELEQGLAGIGVSATLHIMQSNGGVITRADAEAMPLRMLESGPAAGALAASHVAARAGLTDVLSFDMGGTTAKSCLISGGRPEITTDFETARVHRFKKGSGLPVKLPVTDVMEIGAGGGSIARLDATGLLQVGPNSAGASPGPACYGLGGQEPTVTDAALVLGYLDPGQRLGGQVSLHPELAEQAIGRRIAAPLGLSVAEAAAGIHRIVCETMAAAASVHAVEKGKDIRRYTLVAFGGAGPMHAREIARRLGCRSILVPPNAGVFSAVGLLVAPVMMDAVRTLYTRLDRADWGQIESLFAEMERQTAAAVVRAGTPPASIRFERSADMRFIGQGFEVNAPLPAACGPETSAAARRSFCTVYDEIFGHHLESVGVEALSWRVKAVAPVAADGMAIGESGAGPRARANAIRAVRLPDSPTPIDVPVWKDTALPTGKTLEGPALIEQSGCTTVIGAGDTFRVDDAGNLRIFLVQ